MKKVLLGVIGMAMFATACIKETKDVNGDIKNRYEILSSRQWIMVSQKINNVVTPIKDCEKDNYWVFEPNHNGRWEEGANNCLDTNGAETPMTYTDFRWYNTSDQRFIYLKDLGQIGHDPEWEITNMDYKSMDITESARVNGVYYTNQYKFVVR